MPVPSKAFLGRARSAIKWVEENADRAARGRGRRGAGTEPQTARCTSGTADGNGNYPGVITDWDGTAWVDYGAIAIMPLNGEVLVSGDRYTVRPAGTPVGSDPVFVATSPAPGGAPGSLTVEEYDLSPSVASVTHTRFSSATGLVVEEISPGVAGVSLNAATTTVPGGLSIAEQWFMGKKKIENKLEVHDGIVHTGDYVETEMIYGGTAGVGTFVMALARYSPSSRLGAVEVVWNVPSSNYIDFTFSADADNALIPRIVLIDDTGTNYRGGTSGANSDDNSGAAGHTGPIGFFGGIYYGGALFASSTPSASGDAGYREQMHFTASHLYGYVQGTGWRRVAWSSF